MMEVSHDEVMIRVILEQEKPVLVELPLCLSRSATVKLRAKDKEFTHRMGILFILGISCEKQDRKYTDKLLKNKFRS